MDQIVNLAAKMRWSLGGVSVFRLSIEPPMGLGLALLSSIPGF